MAWVDLNDVYVPKTGGVVIGNLEVDGTLVLGDGSGGKVNATEMLANRKLTRFYRLDSDTTIPWDSGTMFCSMSEDGKTFRLSGNTYKSSANAAWSAMVWIPGTGNSVAGYKSFKVATPSEALSFNGVGLEIYSSDLAVGNFNQTGFVIGTDGYIYLGIRYSSPEATNPYALLFPGGAIYNVEDGRPWSIGSTLGSGA